MPDLIRHPVFSGCSGHRRPRGNDFAHVPLITDDLMARHFRHPRAGALLSGINPAINAKPLWPAALEPWVPRGGVAPGGVRRPLSLWRSPAATSLRCSGVGRAAELACIVRLVRGVLNRMGVCRELALASSLTRRLRSAHPFSPVRFKVGQYLLARGDFLGACICKVDHA